MNIWNCEILPSEHLISLLARSHILSGNKHLHSTASKLNIDVTASLKAQEFNNQSLLNITSSCSDLPVQKELILKHTPAALWGLTTLDEKSDAWEPAFLYQQKESNQRQLIEFRRSWHFCPDCVLADKDKNGFSYWHVEHQLPGISHCYIHNTRLITCSVVLSDLRKVSIPQQHNHLEEDCVKQEDFFIEWSQFVYQAFKALQSNPLKAREWKNKVRLYLNPPSKKNILNQHLFEPPLKEFEREVGSELLSFLFKFYKIRPQNTVNILKITLTYYSLNRYSNPIYWLVILFWLRKQIRLEF